MINFFIGIMTILGLADFGSQTTEAFRALRKASKIPKGSDWSLIISSAISLVDTIKTWKLEKSDRYDKSR